MLLRSLFMALAGGIGGLAVQVADPAQAQQVDGRLIYQLLVTQPGTPQPRLARHALRRDRRGDRSRPRRDGRDCLSGTLREPALHLSVEPVRIHSPRHAAGDGDERPCGADRRPGLGLPALHPRRRLAQRRAAPGCWNRAACRCSPAACGAPKPRWGYFSRSITAASCGATQAGFPKPGIDPGAQGQLMGQLMGRFGWPR